MEKMLLLILFHQWRNMLESGKTKETIKDLGEAIQQLEIQRSMDNKI